MQLPALRLLLLVALPLLGAASSVSASAAAPPAASGCNACHGPGGVSASGHDPTIAGLSAAYLNQQMADYRDGSRTCADASGSSMCAIAKGATEAAVQATSEFYAAQTFVAAAQTTAPALVVRGKALHQGRCGMCHTHGGRNAADDAGILAGQWQPYLEATLLAFVDGKRPQPAPMQKETGTLSPDDVHALAEFYASERRR
jgi:sulfide dehydrogenase cytochrome subunit